MTWARAVSGQKPDGCVQEQMGWMLQLETVSTDHRSAFLKILHGEGSGNRGKEKYLCSKNTHFLRRTVSVNRSHPYLTGCPVPDVKGVVELASFFYLH